jgi:hypothetical protein
VTFLFDSFQVFVWTPAPDNIVWQVCVVITVNDPAILTGVSLAFIRSPNVPPLEYLANEWSHTWAQRLHSFWSEAREDCVSMIRHDGLLLLRVFASEHFLEPLDLRDHLHNFIGVGASADDLSHLWQEGQHVLTLLFGHDALR